MLPQRATEGLCLGGSELMLGLVSADGSGDGIAADVCGAWPPEENSRVRAKYKYTSWDSGAYFFLCFKVNHLY